jgi:DNA ligase-associated metallophosphoesterase
LRVNWANLAARVLPRVHAQHEAVLAGVPLVLDRSGALYWPEHGMLVVSDLHLEKGSSFAARGSLLPPYDTHDTLTRLGEAIVRYAPRVVVTLGDNFHDGEGATRLSARDRETLAGLQRGREWIWITGNHDPEPAIGIGGVFADELAVGQLLFRHKSASDATRPAVSSSTSPLWGGRIASAIRVGTSLPEPHPGSRDVGNQESRDRKHPISGGEREASSGEISGHLHPVAVVAMRGAGVRRRCFASDGARMVMPAFGAYAGGLNIRHRAFRGVFEDAEVIAHVMGEERIFAISAERCV